MFGKTRHKFEVNYIYRNDPHAQIIETDADDLSRGQAAERLLRLHNADAENSLVMPDAGADEEELVRQAEVLGITDIRVTRLVHEHEPGTTPGHYQQP
ncbi:HAD family hydrolase [Pseudomonas oligotrophica]|uniref:HAD family hydrolase n=1 Tax=Pseudomonas oligotrophica TaxID=2912055 RepID=UPI001F1E46AE|nr:HAD family hydrolase [Pseudomonas oligotrophica]MCF7201499.1 HAD family hydrolase [Pseudomonas oligotrophica]